MFVFIRNIRKVGKFHPETKEKIYLEKIRNLLGLGLKSSIHNIGKFFLHKSIGNFFRVIFFVFLAFELESATDSPYIYYLSFLVHRYRKSTVKTDFDTPGRFNQSCHLTASILSIVLCQALIKWGLTKDMGFSFPNSWYSFS